MSPCVSPTTPVKTVADMFFDEPDLDAIALAEDGLPSGLITRPRLLVRLARNFGYQLVARKAISQIADPSPLVLPEGTDVDEAVNHALARSDDAVYDEVIVVKDGGEYRGLLSVRRLVLQQTVVLAHSRKDREEALSRAAHLERLDAARSRFLAHATHELRGPLGVITGAAHLIRQSVERGAWEEVRDRLPLLLRAATNLRGSVDNILDLSKLEAEKADVVLAKVEVASLVEDLAISARLLAGAKDVAVEATLSAAPRFVASDPQKLRQILVNLVSNAAKFTDRGRIEIGAALEEDEVRFWVTDTGVGIRDEDLPRLFVPFGQVREARTGSHAGTGLGLVIARSLAELLRGRLTVSSRYGEGTTFSLHLPQGGTSERAVER